MCMASGTALAAFSTLSPESKMKDIRSSNYQSTFPCLRGFTATSAGKDFADRIFPAKISGFGICARCGLCVLDGSQSALARMSLERLVVLSDM